MPIPEIQALFDVYPTVIEQMPKEFTSHKFILVLAQQHQTDYVKALYHHCDTAPFLNVHKQLAQQLSKHGTLIEQIADASNDPDIFGNPQTCSQWRKVSAT